jgi:hypothetical protein
MPNLTRDAPVYSKWEQLFTLKNNYNDMKTHKSEGKKQIISKELMLDFLHYLDVKENDLMKIAYYVAKGEGKGTYFAMFNEAVVISSFGQFLLEEHDELLDKMTNAKSLPMADLLNMPLTESELKKYGIH